MRLLKSIVLLFVCMLFTLEVIFSQTPAQAFNPGLLWRTGVAPQPSIPLRSGSRVWYVDASAPDGGDGSIDHPFNRFDELFGYNGSSGYVAGALRGSDHVYIAGEFRCGDDTRRTIDVAREFQGGTPEYPTLITTWPGKPRAVFNGQGVAEAGIVLRNTASFRIESIEFHDFVYFSIRAYDGVSYVYIVNVETHALHGSSPSGTGSGISLSAVDTQNDFTVRNCLIYNHKNNSFAVAGIYVLSERWTTAGSIVKIYDNIVFDEHTGIGDKHSGNLTIQSHGNLVYNCVRGFYSRAYFSNQLFQNIVYNCEDAFVVSRENIQGNLNIIIHNNTVINSRLLRLIDPITTLPNGNEGYKDFYHVYDNIHVNNASAYTLTLGAYADTHFDLAGWQSGKNIFYPGNATNFLVHQGSAYSFSSAMSRLNDTTSAQNDPLFANIGACDFRLTSTSPARGFGQGGTDIGALSFGSTYILDFNRYTIMGGINEDTTSPSVPQNLLCQSVSSVQALLQWTASTDNVGVSGYKVYRNGVYCATTPTTAYTDSGLSPSTEYTYRVSAFDYAGNESAQSDPLTVTTTSAVLQTLSLVPSSILWGHAKVYFSTVSATNSTDFRLTINNGSTQYPVTAMSGTRQFQSGVLFNDYQFPNGTHTVNVIYNGAVVGSTTVTAATLNNTPFLYRGLTLSSLQAHNERLLITEPEQPLPEGTHGTAFTVTYDDVRAVLTVRNPYGARGALCVYDNGQWRVLDWAKVQFSIQKTGTYCVIADNAYRYIPQLCTSKIGQNYPNPFNPTTTITVDVAENGHVELSVFDVKGRKVTTLTNQTKDAGRYDIVWNGCDERGKAMPSGVYYAVMTLNGKKHVRKMVMLK